MRMLRGLGLIIILMTCFLTAGSYAAVVKPLKPDQAFQFSYTATTPSTVIAEWKIAPGYYLYRDRFLFSTQPAVKIAVQYPALTVALEKLPGGHAGYTGQLKIPVVLPADAGNVVLQITYQGCSTQGFCYPPMKQSIALAAVVQSDGEINGLTGLVKDQQKISQIFALTTHTSVLLMIFVGLGLLLSFTPCVLPMIPILTSIIVGQQGKVSTRKAFLLSVSYVLGTSLAYAAAGVAAAMMGSSMQVWLQQPIFIYMGACLFTLLALSLFGVFEVRMPAFMRNVIVALSNQQRGGAYVGVFLMGILSALLVSPCVTAPLVGVLMYIAATGNVVLGGSALFAIGIGMGIPLVVVGMSAGKWLPKRGPWMDAVSKFFGLVMLGMAVWLLSRAASFSYGAMLYGMLLLFGGLIIAVYLPRYIGWHWLNRLLGGMTAVAGLIFVLVAFNVNGLSGWHHKSVINNSFVVVHNQQQLDDVLSAARSQKKPVLVDFYADWCESCVTMEKDVFDHANVREQLKNFILVRVDITENDRDDQILLSNYKVIAPPTVLLVSPKGSEDNKFRMIGEMSAKDFLSRIQIFAQEQCEAKSIC